VSNRSGDGGSYPSGGRFPSGGGGGGGAKIGDTVTAPRIPVVDHDDEGLFYEEAISEIGIAVGGGHKAAGFRYLEVADVGEGEIGGGGAPAGTIVTLGVNHATENPATTFRIRATDESLLSLTVAEEAGIGTAWSAGYGAAGPKAHFASTDPLTIAAYLLAINVDLLGADAHWNTVRGLASNGERVVTEKFPVVAASTADADFATAFAAGATLDGVFLATGDRVLIKNQADASENGIYKVNASGEPTRANDGRDLAMGEVRVTGGTVNQHTKWRCTAENAGLTAGSWTSPLPGSQWGAGPIAEPIDFVRIDTVYSAALAALAATLTTAGRDLISVSSHVSQAQILGSEIPTAGADLGDANATITIAGGAQYILPAATLTANRVLTLGVTGSPITGETIAILRRGTEAFTLTVQDDAATSLLVMPASTRLAAYFRYNGTHFVLASAIRIQ
jgi:hypothetical protein